MGALARKDLASVYADVGVHDGVPIKLATVRGGEPDGSTIYIGGDGPDLSLSFADPESMELLSAVATEGARLMRERIDRLVGSRATA